jgi:hypothetical protein
LRLVTPSSSPCCRGDCMYHGNRGAGAKPNCRAGNAMSTTQTREARSPLPDQQLLAPLSNLTPSLPGNEAGSPVARRKVASCGADGGDSAYPAGIAPPVTTYKAGESFSELPGDRHRASVRDRCASASMQRV